MGSRAIADAEVAGWAFGQPGLAMLGLAPDALEARRLKPEHLPVASALLNQAAGGPAQGSGSAQAP